ncbi:MerR family transcriptional regulator [Dactylosporangium sp. CA-139066]|uniref:MerR family transcriptional regulator n=1 Tax=Dactylosporangium sp. CA-139066 TaxID=3239930 RepID=UPI003D92E8BD
MRMSDLSRRSGLPVPTIKFYLRAGLVAAGTRTAQNQARYDECHLRRLRLIAILTTVGRLGLAAVREILAAVDDPNLSLVRLHEVVGAALFAGRPVPLDDGPLSRAGATIDRSLAGRGWWVDRHSAGHATLTGALAAVQQFAGEADVAILAPYLDAVEALGHQEAAALAKQDAESDRATIVVRIVMFDVILDALRFVAQEHFLRLESVSPGEGPPERSGRG